MDQRSGLLQVLAADRLGRPVCQRGNRARGVISGILREGSCSLHKKIWDVPALQVSVERARCRIAPHYGAATEMGCLIFGYVIRTLAGLLYHLLRAHAREDFGIAICEKGAHLELVLVEIHGEADERPAKAIDIGWIEIKIVRAIAVARGMHARTGIDRAQVVVANRA